MRKRTLWLAGLLAAPALVAQQSAPPHKPVDRGPSLVATMKFIQDKLNDQGRVGYVYTRSDLSAITFREYYEISGVTGDAANCTLHKVETTTTKIEVAEGYNYNEGGQVVTGDDLLRQRVSTSTVHLRKIENIQVEATQNRLTRNMAEDAHPEITFTVTPPVYSLTLVASKPVFSFQQSFTVGKAQAKTSDDSDKADTLTFRDEETANRLAKALTHAVELCGGGDKGPF